MKTYDDLSLIDDLEASAEVAEVNAEECEAAGNDGSAEACRTFAKRQRLHAERLKEAIERAEEGMKCGSWAARELAGRTLDILETINYGGRK